MNQSRFSSERASRLKPSQIREVAELGRDIPGILPLWFGEGAWPTSERAVAAARQAMEAGDHFYAPNSGQAGLRQAISAYQSRWYGRGFETDRITVTASGMQGLALCAQALIDTGDQVICIEPAWPNMAECFRIAGADLRRQTLQIENGGWTLDMQRLIDGISRHTRAVVINSPSNPTGWVMPADEQKALLEHCRRTGTWIVADDVYARLYRHGDLAPGLLALAEPDDRVVSINSFSKAWSMTGWRLGWITAPAALESTLAMLSEFNIAGPAGFIQQAGEYMIRHGESEVTLLRQRLQLGYQRVHDSLNDLPAVTFVPPDGAFYCFFAVDGVRDSLALARSLLHSSGVGLAPGVAFGASGEGFLRLCYAQPDEVLEPALERLSTALGQL